MQNEQELCSTMVTHAPQELPDWLLEDMELFNRTGEITERLMKESAPRFGEGCTSPESPDAFPGNFIS